MFPAQCETSLIQVTSRRAEVLCPFCRDALGLGLQASCAGCMTRYHSDCALELGSCATLGCAGEVAPYRVQVEAEAEEAQGEAESSPGWGGFGELVVRGVLALLPLLVMPYGSTIVDVLAEQVEILLPSALLLLAVVPFAVQTWRSTS